MARLHSAGALSRDAGRTPRQAEQGWLGFLQELDAIWVGTPEYVVEEIEKYRRRTGTGADPDLAAAVRADAPAGGAELEPVAAKVMPRVTRGDRVGAT